MWLWVEKMILRKVLLNIAKLLASYWLAHQGWLIEHLPWVQGLDQVKVSPEGLADALNGVIFIALHEAQAWSGKKWPALARYI